MCFEAQRTRTHVRWVAKVGCPPTSPTSVPCTFTCADFPMRLTAQYESLCRSPCSRTRRLFPWENRRFLRFALCERGLCLCALIRVSSRRPSLLLLLVGLRRRVFTPAMCSAISAFHVPIKCLGFAHKTLLAPFFDKRSISNTRNKDMGWQ